MAKLNRIYIQRKYQRTSLVRKVFQFILNKLPILFLLIVIVIFLQQIMQFNFMQNNINITINSNNLPISIDKIQQQIKPISQQWNMDLQLIKRQIMQNIWIKSVIIKRTWMSLDIVIKAYKISYIWHNIDGSKQGYISQSGDLIIPQQMLKLDKITVVSGSKDHKKAFDNLQSYQKIIPQLQIKTFIKNNIEEIILKNNAKIILGFRKQKSRLKKIVKFYDKFRMHHNSILDLRYQDGFSKLN